MKEVLHAVVDTGKSFVICNLKKKTNYKHKDNLIWDIVSKFVFTLVIDVWK